MKSSENFMGNRNYLIRLNLLRIQMILGNRNHFSNNFSKRIFFSLEYYHGKGKIILHNK